MDQMLVRMNFLASLWLLLLRFNNEVSCSPVVRSSSLMWWSLPCRPSRCWWHFLCLCSPHCGSSCEALQQDAGRRSLCRIPRSNIRCVSSRSRFCLIIRCRKYPTILLEKRWRCWFRQSINLPVCLLAGNQPRHKEIPVCSSVWKPYPGPASRYWKRSEEADYWNRVKQLK